MRRKPTSWSRNRKGYLILSMCTECPENDSPGVPEFEIASSERT